MPAVRVEGADHLRFHTGSVTVSREPVFPDFEGEVGQLVDGDVGGLLIFHLLLRLLLLRVGLQVDVSEHDGALVLRPCKGVVGGRVFASFHFGIYSFRIRKNTTRSAYFDELLFYNKARISVFTNASKCL